MYVELLPISHKMKNRILAYGSIMLVLRQEVGTGRVLARELAPRDKTRPYHVWLEPNEFKVYVYMGS